MNLQLLSIRRVTTTSPEMLYVRVGAKGDTPDGHADAEFEVMITGLDPMKMTLKQIEEAAIERVKYAFLT